MVAGDFIRIIDTVYQVQTVWSDGTVTLNKKFDGDFSDIIKAYYIPKSKVPNALSYQATSAQVKTYIEAQLRDLYPLQPQFVEVSRETLPQGFKWRVTFTGEIFADHVDPLVLISTQQKELSHAAITQFSAKGTPTYNVLASVTTDHSSKAIHPGAPLFVKVMAINDYGISPPEKCIVADHQGNVFAGTIVPRSPPGLPVDVQVWAVPSSDGKRLNVTWSEGSVFGSDISRYEIEVNSTAIPTRWSSASWSINKVISRSDLVLIGDKRYSTLIDVTNNVDLVITVRAFNDQGAGGPRWYNYIGVRDTNAIAEVEDFNLGAQHATPTCYEKQDECYEDRTHIILTRGLPGQPPLLVPLYPRVDCKFFRFELLSSNY